MARFYCISLLAAREFCQSNLKPPSKPLKGLCKVPYMPHRAALKTRLKGLEYNIMAPISPTGRTLKNPPKRPI
jgi:hypothetical protein